MPNPYQSFTGAWWFRDEHNMAHGPFPNARDALWALLRYAGKLAPPSRARTWDQKLWAKIKEFCRDTRGAR